MNVYKIIAFIQYMSIKRAYDPGLHFHVSSSCLVRFKDTVCNRKMNFFCCYRQTKNWYHFDSELANMIKKKAPNRYLYSARLCIHIVCWLRSSNRNVFSLLQHDGCFSHSFFHIFIQFFSFLFISRTNFMVYDGCMDSHMYILIFVSFFTFIGLLSSWMSSLPFFHSCMVHAYTDVRYSFPLN